MVTVVCQQCGKTFEVQKKREKTAKFCSNRCKSLSQQKGISRTCLICGREFTTLPCYIRRGWGTKYCSRDCYFRAKQADKKWLQGNNKEKIRELFAQYRKGASLAKLSQKSNIPASSLSKTFRFTFPEEYDEYAELHCNYGRNYRIGAKFERRARDHYKAQGYFVLRSPHSRGPADLVAIKKGEVLLIQCRTNGTMKGKERIVLADLAKSIGAKAVLMSRKVTAPYNLQIEYLSP